MDARTRVLILGSLPGERSLAEGRYYAHPQNQFWLLVGAAMSSPNAAPTNNQNWFWLLVGAALGEDIAGLPYDDRLAALLARGVGLWDVIATARRSGSSDGAIRNAAANDLAALSDRLPALRAVAFNGAKSAAIGRPQLERRSLALIALPSSSPLHTIGLAAKQRSWNAIAEHLL